MFIAPPLPKKFSVDSYAVFGKPIAHSKSPQIHALFAQQMGERLEYRKYEINEDYFSQAVEEFRLAGGLGLNITVPFKEQAWKLAHKRSERAEQAGAVNTLFWQDFILFGDNTDGAGMVTDIKRQGWDISGKSVLIIGAGGAVKGVLQTLISETPGSIAIVNRTLSRAESLADQFKQDFSISAISYEQLQKWSTAFDLIINASAAGLENKAPPILSSCLHENSACYDMVYAEVDTPFIRWAKSQGCRQTADGFGMLVGQAAESFKLWRGKMPNVDQAIKTLRNSND